MSKLTFHRRDDHYYAETRLGDRADRSYFIRPAPGGGWEVSWYNSLSNADDHDGLDPLQRPATCRTLQDARRRANAWHAYRTRKLQAGAPAGSAVPAAQATSRRPDGKPETPADTRFFDLRESGYLGPIDQDGNPVSSVTCTNCGHPAREHDRWGECHAVDPGTNEPCWGICTPKPEATAPRSDRRTQDPVGSAAPMRCPGCGEPAVHRPPTDLMPWQAHGSDRPAWSHADGSSLCPVIGPDGYQPASPVPAASGPGGTSGTTSGPASLDRPASDAEFLESCAQLAGLLGGLAADVTGWAEDLATLNLPEAVRSPLHAAATAITDAAGHLSEAASAFRETFSSARRSAAGGLRITGEDPA